MGMNDDDSSDDLLLPTPRAGGGLRSHDIDSKSAMQAIGKIVTHVEQCVERATEALEAHVDDGRAERQLKLVALASDNGKLSLAESKRRLDTMLDLARYLDEVESTNDDETKGETDNGRDPGDPS